MDPAWRAALGVVARRLDARAVDYMLGGSGLLWSLGLTTEVGDIDLMLPEDAEADFLDAVAPWPVRVQRGGQGLWASPWLASLELGGVSVEAIGGLAFRDGDRVIHVPFRATGTIMVDGVRVPLADPACWWVLYLRYQPDKARLLESVVAAGERAAAREEMGV